MASLTAQLTAWLDAGGQTLQQVRIRRCEPGADHGAAWEIRHIDDAATEAELLTPHTTPEAARELAKYDTAGSYRPLKGAPSLPSGWRLLLVSDLALHEALDFLYPAAVGNFFRHTAGRSTTTPLRETLGRQTGMYRITGLLTDDDCQEVVQQTCQWATACRRCITWPISETSQIQTLAPQKLYPHSESHSSGDLPYLCLEACNWLVAKGRTFIKAKRAAAGA